MDGTKAGVIVAREVQGQAITTGILIARNVEGNVQTTVDTRGVLIAGAVAGAVIGTCLMLGQYLFRRK